MNDCFNVAGIGVSEHMEEHLLPSLELVKGLRLTRLASRNASRRKELASFYGVKVVEDWRSLLCDEQIHAIIVAGPPQLNQDVIRECMTLGKPVFSEKPICSDIQTAIHLEEIERKTRSFVQIGYNFRYSTTWESIFLLSGEHGKVREISIEFHTNKPRDPIWGLESTLESFLYAIAVHPLEMMSSILGRNESLHYWRNSTPNGGESFILVASDESVNITLKTSNLSPSFVFRVEALFEDGTRAHTDHSTPGLVKWSADNWPGCDDKSLPKIWRKVQFSSVTKDLKRDREGSGYQAQFEELLTALRGGKPSATSVSASMRPHHWIDRMIRELLGD